MIMFTSPEAAKAVKGKLYGSESAELTEVSTDTRTINKGSLYIGIKGERFDGNDFIIDAVENGAAAVISDRKLDLSVPLIVVEDTRKAQLDLARYYRDKFSVRLCGVTGSVGKTSTKDMIYAVLSKKYKTLRTDGNLNNDIGVPKTLFGLNGVYEAAVVEMGMSDKGEISALSKAAHPDCGVITNIGWCHIQNLKTRENILAAKMEITDGMKSNAPLIINGDDEYLKTISVTERKVIRYGFGEENDVRAADITETESGESFRIYYKGKSYKAKVPEKGEHHVLNALAAFCVGKEFQMTADEIIPAFMEYKPSGMRQREEHRNGVTLLLDCYNASPTSMKASLSVLKNYKGRRIAVLGDMLELGEMSEKLHALTADYIEGCADKCFLYGKEMSACRDELSRRGFESFWSADREEVISALKSEVREGDVLLFKGSRGMKLEEIAEKIV